MTEKEAREIGEWIIDKNLRLAVGIQTVCANAVAGVYSAKFCVARLNEIYEEAREIMEADQRQAARDAYPNEGSEYDPGPEAA